jgi:hypothetical protein
MDENVVTELRAPLASGLRIAELHTFADRTSPPLGHHPNAGVILAKHFFDELGEIIDIEERAVL